MRSTIYFNGKSSADFGLIVEYYPESVHAARRGELISIPGRNGAIISEDGAYDTYQQQYEVWFRNTLGRNTYQNAQDVAEWLLNVSGFCRLEDTYEPEHFRMARFAGPLNVETVLKNHGRATLVFDVQPQRYLKIGQNRLRFAQSQSSGAWQLSVELKDVDHLVVAFTGDDYYSDTVNLFKNYPENGSMVTVDGNNGYVDIDPSNYNGESYGAVWLQGSGSKENETTVGVYLNGQRVFSMENGTAYLYNPTNYEARPLLYAEATGGATPVAQSVSMTYSKTVLETGDYYTFYNYPIGISNTINVSSYRMARITTEMYSNGCIYAFFDSSDKLISGRWGQTNTRIILDEEAVPIPTGAVTMVVGAYDTAQAYTPSVALAGASTTNVGFFVGNTAVNIDFAASPSLYIDSELHDAYYDDGTSANDRVLLTNWDDPYQSFPVLTPRWNALNVAGATLRLDITPRWWIL